MVQHISQLTQCTQHSSVGSRFPTPAALASVAQHFACSCKCTRHLRHLLQLTIPSQKCMVHFTSSCSALVTSSNYILASQCSSRSTSSSGGTFLAGSSGATFRHLLHSSSSCAATAVLPLCNTCCVSWSNGYTFLPSCVCCISCTNGENIRQLFQLLQVVEDYASCCIGRSTSRSKSDSCSLSQCGSNTGALKRPTRALGRPATTRASATFLPGLCMCPVNA